MRVDLPAPFSPTSAWISPARTRKSTRSSATTPGNVLRMLRISRRWSKARLLDLRCLVVAAAHQHGFPVGLVHAHRLEQVRGNDLHAVVVGLGVVDLRLLARQHG